MANSGVPFARNSAVVQIVTDSVSGTVIRPEPGLWLEMGAVMPAPAETVAYRTSDQCSINGFWSTIAFKERMPCFFVFFPVFPLLPLVPGWEGERRGRNLGLENAF